MNMHSLACCAQIAALHAKHKTTVPAVLISCHRILGAVNVKSRNTVVKLDFAKTVP